MLKDAGIRKALLNHLGSRAPKPERIIEELHVHNGNAIADIVAIYKRMHCFEIKGETDSIQRITRQAEIYSHSFPKLTLVITRKHIKWAEKNLPPYWGILVASMNSEKVVFKYQRPAMNNPDFIIEKALMMLWKQELLDISLSINLLQKKAQNRNEIANTLSKSLSKEQALQYIQGAIIRRSSALVPHN